MNVKAQGLLNAVKWIEDTYGQAALRDIVRACGQDVRDRYVSAIAINWHPLEELVELLDAADKYLGKGDGKIAEEVGAAGARSNMRGAALRLVFYLSKPEFLMRRIATLWSQFNDEGTMELVSFEEHSATIEVKGIGRPHWLFCCTLTGWAREVVVAAGGSTPVVRHAECRARGGTRCLWQLRWSGASVSEAVSKAAERLSRPPPSSPSSPSSPPPSFGAPSTRRRSLTSSPPPPPSTSRLPASRASTPDPPPSSRRKPK